MANRYFNNNCFSLHKMPVLIDASITFGASGAVSSFKGLGVKGITKPASSVGVYQIELEDSYSSLYGMDFNALAGPTLATTFVATDANASPTLTLISSMRGLAVGQHITGTGIAANTVISAINAAANTITMSNNAGSSNSAITVTVDATAIALTSAQALTGALYQIVSLGNNTAAQWAAAGLPTGVTAAVGQAFVYSGTGAGTGTVLPVVPSQIVNIEIAGDELSGINVANPNGFLSPTTGRSLITVMMLDASNVAINPASGTKVQMCLYLSNSSVILNGVIG